MQSYIVSFSSTLNLIVVIFAIYMICRSHNKSKERLKQILSSALVLMQVIAFGLQVLFFQVTVPDILPRGGNITSEYPSIRLSGFGSDFLETYYVTDPGADPIESGTLYTEAFIPPKSETYYFKSKFLFWTSGTETYTVTTSEDSHKELGIQDGVSNEEIPMTEAAEKNVDWGSTDVSQEHTFSYSSLPEGLRSGWGDNAGGRTSFTIEEINEGKLNDQIIFNTISDSVIGDEKNFVAARENVELPPEERLWSGNLIDVEIGKEYLIRIYGHNNSPEGYDCVAENVEIQFQIPEESGRSVVVHGLISSSNANPSLYWDGVIFTCETPFRLEYVQGSAKINGIGHGTSLHLSDSIVNNWVTIGYRELDGRIPGCYQYAFYATIRVRAVEADEAE